MTIVVHVDNLLVIYSRPQAGQSDVKDSRHRNPLGRPIGAHHKSTGEETKH
jgi:hypothetical protein